MQHKVSVVIVKDDQYLILKRTKDRGDFWQVLSGTVEENESIVAAAYREIFEETKLFIKSFSKEIGSNTFTISEGTFTEHIFIALVTKKDPVIDSFEHTEYKWCTKEEATKLTKWDADKIEIAANAIQNLPDIWTE